MSDNMSETKPVILIGVRPTVVPGIDNIEIAYVNEDGLEYSTCNRQVGKVSLQLVNNKLKIILDKEG